MNAQRSILSVVPAVLLLLPQLAPAEELKSGLQPGEECPCLSVIWLVNWPDDGSYQGCMIHDLDPAGPVAIVFIRTVDDRVAQLVLALNLQVAEWGSRQGPHAFVCGVGGVDHEHLAAIKKSAVDVPLTIPGRSGVGHRLLQGYKLSDKAAVTVIVYDGPGNQVRANYAISETEDLTPQKIKQIVKALTAGGSD